MKKIILMSIVISISLNADSWIWGEKKGVAPVKDKLYLSECASCHFGYQAGLLPSRSWKKVMGNLENHFGTDASLESEDKIKILKYLEDNAAEKFTKYKRSRKINDSIPKYSTPIAITKTPYIIRKHDEIPRRLITQKDVKSLANCKSCHTSADKGNYSDDYVKIPNYGRWDD